MFSICLVFYAFVPISCSSPIWYLVAILPAPGLSPMPSHCSVVWWKEHECGGGVPHKVLNRIELPTDVTAQQSFSIGFPPSLSPWSHPLTAVSLNHLPNNRPASKSLFHALLFKEPEVGHHQRVIIELWWVRRNMSQDTWEHVTGEGFWGKDVYVEN